MLLLTAANAEWLGKNSLIINLLLICQNRLILHDFNGVSVLGLTSILPFRGQLRGIDPFAPGIGVLLPRRLLLHHAFRGHHKSLEG